MSTEQQKDENVYHEPVGKSTKIDDFFITKTGTMIIGSEYVGEKLTALLCEAINYYHDSDSHPAVVVLRADGRPKDAFGMMFADTYSITINLQKIWDQAVAVCMEGKKFVALHTAVLIGYLTTIGHELDHLDFAFKDRDLYDMMREDDEGNKELEAGAQANEEAMLLKLAQDFDTEIPAVEQLGWFGIRIMDLFTNEDTKDLDWVVRSRRMMEEGCTWHNTDHDIKTLSFRDFVIKAYDVKGSAWEQPVANITLSMYLEDGSVEERRSNPVEAAEVQAMKPEEIVESNAAAVELVMQPNTEGTFVQYADAEAEEVVGDSPDAEEDENYYELQESDVQDASNTLPAADPQAGDTFVVPAVEDAPVIAEQKAAAAAGAASATPKQEEPPTTYPANNYSVEQIQGFMKATYQLVYHHIFTKCGWQQDPATQQWFFASPANVLQAIDLRGAMQHFGIGMDMIMSYDTKNAQGQPSVEQFAGVVRGHTVKEGRLPRYTLYLNMFGRQVKRTILPQNPETQSQSAVAARTTGSKIAYIMKEETPRDAGFMEKCSVVIKDNDYQVIG